MSHFVSAACAGECCDFRTGQGGFAVKSCGKQASHKVGEEIPHDDPSPIRHNLTAYLCCSHFVQVVGAPCFKEIGS